MKRKVLATVLCAAIIAIAMGFVVVAKTADASLRTGGDFKVLGEIPTASSSKPNGNESENEQSETAAEESTEAAAGDVTDEAASGAANEVTSEAADGMNPANTETVPATKPVEDATASEATCVSNENELRSALQESGKIVLDRDIQVTGTNGLQIGEGIKITIDGAGHSIYSGENPDLRRILWISKNAEVSLQDVIIDATGMDYVEDWEAGSSGTHDYYAIQTLEGSRLAIGNGAKIICNDDRKTINNQRKGGIFLCGAGIMDGGEISGFYIGGITVDETAEFTLVSGTISKIHGGSGGNGGGINNLGFTTIKGGTLSENVSGVLNSGKLLMINGNMTANRFGIINNPEDAITHEQYEPGADLKGGTITGNEVSGVQNCEHGTLIIDGVTITDEVEGKVFTGMSVFAKSQKSDSSSVLISNEISSTLRIYKGSIVSNAPNGIAVYNDDTSKVVMTGGTIAARGVGSVAIHNDNTQARSVTLTAGSVDAAGNTVGGNGSTYMDGVIVNGVSTNTPAPSGSGSSGGSGGSGGSGRIITSNSATMPSIPETPGVWVQDQTGWKFVAPNQTPYVNTWIRSKNQWYWVGADSYMRTGWNQIAEKWYYLTPFTGEMKTGWLQDGDSWYYLDETGARKTGWLQDGMKWYYLNQDGKMAANTTTPDGYKVDGSGAWVK